MWKKILAVLLILTVGISVLWYANPLSPAIQVSADTYKSGFSVIAEKEDASGVLLDSRFVVTSETWVSASWIAENVTIRDEEDVAVEAGSGNSYYIAPAKGLEANRVYFIDIKTTGGETATFAFQTKKEFTVMGTLPDKMSTYVPLDTGIELYFSYPDVQNLTNYFEITPSVKGRFENHGYAVVFVPQEKLQAGTVYTVNVKKGLGTSASGSATLEKDYSFSFETSPDETATANPDKGYLNLSGSWFDVSSNEKPVLPFDMYLQSNKTAGDVKVSLKFYRYPSADAFIKAVLDREETPIWASYSYSNSRIDVTGLTKALEFTQTFNMGTWQQRYMQSPETLPDGFYVAELTSGDLVSQAFVQVSKIAAYAMGDASKTLFWLNDSTTSKPIANATIQNISTSAKGTSGSDGLATLVTPDTKTNDSASGTSSATSIFYRVTGSDGSTTFVNGGYSYATPYYDYANYTNTLVNNESLYWRYIQTDRTLYKPSDTVQFWGFLKSRVDNTFPEDITVDLASGGYYYPMASSMYSRYLPFLSKPLKTLKLSAEGGFYNGAMELPALDPGYYTLTVRVGGEIVSSSYISVENYVKPQYQLEITSDKKAVFVEEPITFKIKASFFEGTPVSNTAIRYNINEYGKSVSGTGTTDKDGILTVNYTPKYTSNMQGESYFGISATASLPESADVTEYYDFRVFANTTGYKAQGTLKDGKGVLTLTAAAINLATLNDDIDDNDNPFGAPQPNQSVKVNLYRVVWEKYENGEEYDYINKVVRKTYNYREKKTLLASPTLTTGADGAARYEFKGDTLNEGYYLAEYTTTDTKGRSIKGQLNVYPGNMYNYPSKYDYDNFGLKTDKESYREGEPVEVTFVNNGTPITGFKTLFVESRNGISEFAVKSEPKYTRTFDEKLAPNYFVNGIYFNGKTYITGSTSVTYDYTEKELDLTLSTDKTSYRPGDEIEIAVTAKDKSGKPVEAMVNISLVDEALLKLSGNTIEPLQQLYSFIGSGITTTFSNRNYGGLYTPYITGVSFEEGSKTAVSFDSGKNSGRVAAAASEAPMAMAGAGQMADSGYVRSEFKDTAGFATVKLDSKGEGTLRLKLPDNITSFSLSAAAVSQDLKAGSKVQSTVVSMPFFINASLSQVYLTGDKPYIGMTAYGEDLWDEDVVSYKLTIKNKSDYEATASAKAFERVNLALPALTEGTYTLQMSAQTKSGLIDVLEQTITVLSSHRTMEATTLTKLAAGTVITGGKSGLTTLLFTDTERSRLINELSSLAWSSGKRLDQRLVANAARTYLDKLLADKGFAYDTEDITLTDYRNEDGGYGILPYAGSDLKLTALLAPYLKELSDTSSLKAYFYNEVLSGGESYIAALYGLSVLGEPVLLDLEKASKIENSSLENTVLLALSFDALGDTAKAKELYNGRISPLLERKDPVIRVPVTSGNTDESYKLTALTAALASRINSADAAKLYTYVERNYSKTEYAGVEKIMYLSDSFVKLPKAKASFTYTYEGKTYTTDLSDKWSEVISVPSIKLPDLKITGVEGDVTALSFFEAPFTQGTAQSTGITVSRTYFDMATGKEATTFKQDDVVKVVIRYTIDKAAIDNTYEISDYAPSGLKPIAAPWTMGIKDTYGCFYRLIEGQKVTFIVGKQEKASDYKELVYYARVASPGEFTAEGTVAQGSLVKTDIFTLQNTVLRVEP